MVTPIERGQAVPAQEKKAVPAQEKATQRGGRIGRALRRFYHDYIELVDPEEADAARILRGTPRKPF